MKSSVIIRGKHGTNTGAKCVCATPNDRAERFIVGSMSASFMRFNVAQDDGQNVQNPGQNERHGCGSKKWKCGMTPTPPANASPGGNGGVPGDETSAIPARSLRT